MGSSEPRTPPRKADIEGTTPKTCSGPTGDLRDQLPGPSGIVLVEDDWVVLSRLREIIEQTYDLVVVGACRCAEGAMLAVERYRPAVGGPRLCRPPPDTRLVGPDPYCLY